MYLDDVRIPAWRMIGAPGAGMRIALRALDHSRITVGVQAVGIGQGALDCALAYTGQRQQFGQPVAAFQGVQFMLADMAAHLEAARSLVYTAAAKSQRDDLSLTYFASAAKCFASDTAMAVTTDAVQLLGAYGFSEDYPVTRMMRDAKITQIYEETNQIYSPDRAAIDRAATAPSGKPLDAQATATATLTRSHCEVADQWSYPELMELLTTAREHFFLNYSIPAEIGRLAVAAPIRSMAAVFQRAMYVFDSCRIITRAYVLPEQQDAVMFGHEVHDPVHPGQCLTAWEMLRPV